MGYWANFARDGAPWALDGPQWPAWHQAADLEAAEPSRPWKEPQRPWPEPQRPGAMLNITASPFVVIVHPSAKGCAFLAREWEYLQVCLPENPPFNLSGPEVATFIGAAQPQLVAAVAIPAEAGWLPVYDSYDSFDSYDSNVTATNAMTIVVPIAGTRPNLWFLMIVIAGGLCFCTGMAAERLFQVWKNRCTSSLGSPIAPLLANPTATPLLYKHKAQGTIIPSPC